MFFKKKKNWCKIETAESFSAPKENAIIQVEIEAKKICLTHHNGKWYGFSDNCPHAGGSMAMGYVDSKGFATCPLHDLRFNLKNGMDDQGDGYFLKVYPIEVRKDGLYIEIESKPAE